MPKRKVKFILNPNADMGHAWRVASDLRPIVEEFGGADWAGTVYPTHAKELALQAANEGYELVIAAGGDGTVHEIANGLMEVDASKRPRLGVVPLGSGNDFSHAVGASDNPAEALRQALSGSPKPIDIGKVVDDRGRYEYIDNTMGIGFDATVTIRSHQSPWLRGFLMYFIAVLQTIILNHNPVKMKIKTDQEEMVENVLMFVMGNGPREGGGFMVTPDAVMDDGVFHYATIGDVSRPMMFRLVPEVMKGTHGRFDVVRMGKFKSFDMEADAPLIIHIDGEVFAGFGTDVRKLKVDVIPKALEVVV